MPSVATSDGGQGRTALLDIGGRVGQCGWSSATYVVNFIERAPQERFYPRLYGALDHQLRILHANGIGVQRKRADIIILA